MTGKKQDLAGDWKRSKQRLGALLLKHGRYLQSAADLGWQICRSRRMTEAVQRQPGGDKALELAQHGFRLLCAVQEVEDAVQAMEELIARTVEKPEEADVR